jgi:hypothetical protein
MIWQFGVFGFVFTFLLQHAGRTLQWTWTPGHCLNLVAIQCEHVWRFLGTASLFFGHVFDHIYYHAGGLLITLQEIVVPTVRLLASPLSFFDGWWDAFKSFSWEYSGVLAIVAVLLATAAIVWYFCQDLRLYAGQTEQPTDETDEEYDDPSPTKRLLRLNRNTDLAIPPRRLLA